MSEDIKSQEIFLWHIQKWQKDNGELCNWFDKLELSFFFFPLQKNYTLLFALPCPPVCKAEDVGRGIAIRAKEEQIFIFKHTRHCVQRGVGKRDKNDLPCCLLLYLILSLNYSKFGLIFLPTVCPPPPLSTLPFPTQYDGIQVQGEMFSVAFQVVRGDVLASRGQPYMFKWLLEKYKNFSFNNKIRLFKYYAQNSILQFKKSIFYCFQCEDFRAFYTASLFSIILLYYC